MNKYQNGKIYKITSKQTDDVYIGSTIQPLSYRLRGHRHSYNKDINASSKSLMKYDDIIIELIEYYPCNSCQELLWRERYWIENIKCINILIPIKTYKERRELDNLKHREHYENNKEQYNKRSKISYEKNKELYKKQNKIWYENNKEQHNKRSIMRQKFQRTEFGKLCKMF